jgi:PTH1 family peptidyl-tRNA hydrolase
MIKLFVGLGNPGPEYEQTRHNAGFWWLDAFAKELGSSFKSERQFSGHTAKASAEGHTLWLLKPQTFMNLSGQSVGALARFYKIAPSEILVVHDELDIPPGEAKLRFAGSHAGHNGLRDIHEKLGSDAYWRLRVGIGHPGAKSEVLKWVLQKPTLDQSILIDQCIQRTLKAYPLLITGDTQRATQQIHTSKPPRPKPPRPNAELKTSPDSTHNTDADTVNVARTPQKE